MMGHMESYCFKMHNARLLSKVCTNNNVIRATDEYLKTRDKVEIQRAEGISFFLLNKSQLPLFFCFVHDKIFIAKQLHIVQQIFLFFSHLRQSTHHFEAIWQDKSGEQIYKKPGRFVMHFSKHPFFCLCNGQAIVIHNRWRF